VLSTLDAQLSIGAILCRVKLIVPVVTLFALSLTTTCRMYVPSVFAVTKGSSVVVEEKVIVPVPAIFDRVYPDIPAISPVVVMLIVIHVFVDLSAPIVKSGAVLSILYTCCPVVIFPALSITHAYPV